ncbi:MAG: NAD(P)H-hydrate dehydratase, partial [Saprospiraceae bacterium]
MKIYNADQIRAWDAYTIENEPISSVNLMNRAAYAFVEWFVQGYPDSQQPVCVLAGTGNNGGDGLAVARLLQRRFYAVKVFVCDFNGKRSADFEAQRAALPEAVTFIILQETGAPLALAKNEIVVDALFGTGLSRPLADPWPALVDYLNTLPNEIVAIDLPSGLFADRHTEGPVVQATRSFSFEQPKRAFFFPENAGRVGDWAYGPIGLHSKYERDTDTLNYYLTPADVQVLIQPRSKFSHKGSFGHALLVAGSRGKIGAAVLSARACLRSGVGLLTVHIPGCGYSVLQTAVPEAMCSTDENAGFITQCPDLQKVTAIGVGPGLDMQPETADALYQLLKATPSSMVLDADALNLLSQHPDWWPTVPENSILTPHPKEFERLFGPSENDFSRHDLQREMAQKHGVIIVLKGAHTAIALPDGSCWFNSTGNPGMATGGTGDVLTGIVTGLLAQGYAPAD